MSTETAQLKVGALLEIMTYSIEDYWKLPNYNMINKSQQQLTPVNVWMQGYPNIQYHILYMHTQVNTNIMQY